MSRLFSGATDVVNCGSASSLDNVNVFTWCAWVYCTNNTATKFIMTKGLTSAKSLQLDASNVNGGIDCIMEMSGTTCRSRNNTSTNLIPQNSWLWICFQVSSSFVGSVYTAAPGGTPTEISYTTHSTGTGSAASDAASNLYIGGDASNSFPGRIAEVKVWNVNLTQGERIAAMQGFPVRMGNLKGYWPLQAQGSSEPDFSGNKNTGTVTGATQAKNPPVRNLFSSFTGWTGAFTASASGTTGTLAKTNANDTSSASGTSTVTGALAKTNTNDTSSASGTSTVTGTLAKTNANDTSAASGSGTVNGSLAKTNADDTSAASGTSTVTGTLAKTNANDTCVASGANSGSVSYTNANDSLSASGTSTVTGSLAKTSANDTSAASGTSTVNGSLAKTNANDSVSASGTSGSSATGSVNYTNANDSLSASGKPGVTGSANITNANDSVSAAGNVSLVGLLAVMNANDLAAALGITSITGSLAYTNANDYATTGAFTPENVNITTPITTGLNLSCTTTTGINLNTVIIE